MARAVIAGAVCAAAVAGMLTPAEAAVPDLSGFWARTTFGMEPPASGQGPIQPMNRRRADGSRIDSPQFNVGDDSSPILKPAAAAAVRKRNEMQRQGVDYPSPSNQCTPMIAPYAFRVQGMQVLQTKDEVMFLYMQDHQVRHVRLNAQHPAKVAPAWWGDSVGHFEGDTLVVDTTNFKTHAMSMVDPFGTPHTDKLHVVERYRVINDQRGKGLDVTIRVEDPGTFTMPWAGKLTYRVNRVQNIDEVICSENNVTFDGKPFGPLPEEKNPQF